MKIRSLSSIVAVVAIAVAALPFGAAAQTTRGRAAIPTAEPSPILPAVPTVAPGYGAPYVRPAGADIVGVTQQPFVGIALDDAIAMALMKNPDLAVSASDTRIAGYQIVEAKGAFNVRFNLQPSVTHSSTAPENAFFAGPNFGPIVQNQQQISAGFGGQLQPGTQYNLSVSQSRIDNNGVINAFNPYFPTSLNVALTQPLLRGLNMSQARQQLELAVLGSQASSQQTLANASSTIEQTEDAYWDLVAAWRNVAIQEDALQQAIAQQHSNVRLAQRGAAAPIDAVESSEQVATFQDDVISALQNVATLQNELKMLVVDDPADPIWRANLMPTSPVLQLPPMPTYEELVSTALAHRPEVLEVQAQRREADVNLAYAKSQALPQADLNVNWQSNGLAGNALPPIGGAFGDQTPPPDLHGGLGQSYANTWSNKFPTYAVGVTVSAPLGNETARGEIAAAREQQRIGDIQTAGVKQRIEFESRNALQAYQSSLSRLYAARHARETSEEVLASEIRKFHNGVSTTFLVLQRQVELAQARGRELQAQTDLNKAVVELQRASGAILAANNVNLTTLGAGAPK